MRFRITLFTVLATTPFASAQDEAKQEISFNRDIRPIFSETCFNCHGPDKESREENLRFDLPESAFAEREGGYHALVPGDPEASEAWLLINDPFPEYRMPPPESNMTLTAEQKATIKQWIEEGAPYETHWAFEVPTKNALPEAAFKNWYESPIDRFVGARLKEEGLTPNEEADRRTLIRRLSFDLTGLPPSVEEINEFLNDKSPIAYEKLVDRLLASPHYGERMALNWLDQARYADTNGYSRDGGRTMWLWRDWVIQAYNDDKPFSEFLREQLAGDLLPEATKDQIVATGFNRNHMITAEGGTIPEENLTNYAIDRVKTTSETFLGLTMACAQCHDHKYDPISAKDYYQFFAYFNTLDDEGLDGARGENAEPVINATTSLKHRDHRQVKDRISNLNTLLEKRNKQRQEVWEKQTRRELGELGREFKLHALSPAKINSPNVSQRDVMKIQEDGSMLALTTIRNFYSMVFEIPDTIDEAVSGVRVEFYPHEQVNNGSLGYGTKDELGAFAVTGVSVSSGNLPVADLNINRLIPLADATASYSHPDYPVENVLDPRAINAWSPLGRINEPQHLTIMLSEPVNRKEASHLTVMVNFQQIGGPGHFRVHAITGKNDETNIPEGIQEILTIAATNRTPEEVDRIGAYQKQHDPGLARLREELEIAETRLLEMTGEFSTQVMNTAEDPRKTFILERGSYENQGEEVSPSVLEFLLPIPEDAPRNRLALADWFLHADHPLTSRVAVNRIWQMIFGTGMVSTSADFGSQGEWPSHPKLLDWLAVDFRENGWQVKRLIKQIVTSSAYQQDSRITADKLEVDPDNRLLARGPRMRLQAEFIRDAMLQQSGLLNDWIGGSSVKPYQPQHIWREISHYGSVTDTTQIYVQDHASNLYRRSMYTLWKRTNPPPAMVTFDAPNRELCVMKRESTNTPLQALVLLNDVQFVEIGRYFAQRLLQEQPQAEDPVRIASAFETITSRPPSTEELNILVEALSDQREIFRQDQKASQALLSYGEYPRDRKLDPAEHAAYSQVVSLIMNLSESITKP